MRKFALLIAFLMIAAHLEAQTTPEAVVSWDIEIYAAGAIPGTNTPVSIMNFTKATATCNLTPIANPGTVSNPTKIFLGDPINAGKDCQVGPTTSDGFLMSLPAQAGMFAIAIAKGATLSSARSAASNPFNRVITIAPVVPANLRVQ